MRLFFGVACTSGLPLGAAFAVGLKGLEVMTSVANLQPDPAPILACTISRDVQNFDLLIDDMELRGLSGGTLANSAAAEALTSILIYMNKTYKADGAGIRFTRLANAPAV